MEHSYRLLAVDDEPDILRTNRRYLEARGYQVDTAVCAADALKRLGRQGYDCILLDVLLPDMNGYKLCEAVRSLTSAPILFLSCMDDEADKIKGLMAGGDDYITKPFSIKELIARIQMHLRREERSHNASKEEMESNITFYRDSQEVYYQSKRISLTKREFDLLYLLAKNKNRIFSIEELYNYLYPVDSDAQLRSITEYIYQIRQKFKIHQIDPIKTVWGGGYKWKEN